MEEFNKVFPELEDKITFVVSSVFVLALHLSAYRSAYKKDWGAAIWKTVVAQESNRVLNRVVRKRAKQLELTGPAFAWYNT